MSSELKNYITAEEWSFVAEFSGVTEDNDFNEVKQQIIDNRKKNITFPLKKADVLLGGFVGSWRIFDKEEINGTTIYKLNDLSRKIVLEKLKQLSILENNFDTNLCAKFSDLAYTYGRKK